MPTRKYQLADATPGMVLSRPVKISSDMVLVQQDVELNERLLRMLASRGVEFVYVLSSGQEDTAGTYDHDRHNQIMLREVLRFGDVTEAPIMSALYDAVVNLKTINPTPVGTLNRPETPGVIEMVDVEILNQRAKKIRSLATLPEIYHQVNTITCDSKASSSDVARVVNGDPAFALALLKMANSALYGRNEPVTTVTRAVSMLGHKQIRSLCLMTSILEVMSLQGTTTGPVDLVWSHAIATASAAKVLGQNLRQIPEDELFLAGLLHDVGMLFWLQYYPQQLATILVAAEAEGLPLHLVERDRTGTSHQRLGRLMVQRWGLPGQYIDTIAYHHSPDMARSTPLICQTVHIADALVQALELTGQSLIAVPTISPLAWEALELDLADLPLILDAIWGEYDENKEHFGSYLASHEPQAEAVRSTAE
ncbi:MAG: HDOD domain-containing protein [bacterium]